MIKTTYADRPDLDTTAHVGTTVRSRTYMAQRNHSDTLDYSDWRSTQVTEVLVYRGRRGTRSIWMGTSPSEFNPLVELDVKDRFVWIDCTNLFTWRGEGHKTFIIDADMSNPELVEDLGAWWDLTQQEAAETKKRKRLDEIERAAFEAKRERDRVVRGKKMVVSRGRKVPIGTVGEVVWVGHGSYGLRAGLKDASGTVHWLAATNLEAV